MYAVNHVVRSIRTGWHWIPHILVLEKVCKSKWERLDKFYWWLYLIYGNCNTDNQVSHTISASTLKLVGHDRFFSAILVSWLVGYELFFELLLLKIRNYFALIRNLILVEVSMLCGNTGWIMYVVVDHFSVSILIELKLIRLKSSKLYYISKKKMTWW